MKSDRLLALLLALQNDGKCAAPALAESMEVSVRTIYRDVDALSAAGIPVSAERGVNGGIVLADSYRDALARFDEGELRALFVSSDDVLTDIGLVGRRGSALAKLAASLPRGARSSMERNRGRVHVDSRGWYKAAQAVEPLAALRDAVWSDRRVAIGYRDREGKLTRRTLDPLGLVAKAGVWYLVARDRGDIKTFRVQRVARVRVLDERFERPRDFDVGTYWKSSSWTGDPQSMSVVVRARMSERALNNARVYLNVESHKRIPRSSPKMSLVQIKFTSFPAAAHEVFGWNEEVEILEPPELREALLERAQQLVARYSSDKSIRSRTSAGAIIRNDE